MTLLGPGAEFDLIRRFLAADAAGRLPFDIMVGPGDDATVISAHPLAVSTDLSIEGVHFRRDWLEPEEIGWRAATAAFSDLAAMIARPIGLLLSIGASREDAGEVSVRIARGAAEAARACDARLVGGDLTRSPGPLILDAVVVGEVSQPLRRDGARPGDEVWVTGRLGAPASAVRQWLAGGDPAPGARARFARPVARTREALWLRQHVDMTAGIDLSDGLAGDLPHIAAASRVGIVVDRFSIPVHEAAAEAQLALTGGEEYELVLVSPRGAMQNVVAEFESEFGVPLTRIGEVVARDDVPPASEVETSTNGVDAASGVVAAAEVWLRDRDGSVEPMPAAHYSHFMEGH